VAEGRQVFVAGQIGWDAQQAFVSDNFVAQTEQALHNITAVLAEAGGRPEHVVRLTWYVVDKREYLAAGRELGAAYRRVFGKHFPAMSAVQVVALMEDRARVEIEATAVIPVS
jgi:enamine deaminase RidA (YjgF/YER057c/UK114 family)